MPRPINALIVDDEPHIRSLVRMLLNQVGITMAWDTGNAAEAVAMVERHDAELLLLDIDLPVGAADELLARIRKLRPRIPVIVVSSQPEARTTAEAVRLGAVAYLFKHGSSGDALKNLREVLGALENANGGTRMEN